MKYEVEINGRQVTVELEERDDHLTAIIGERRYEIDVARPEDGVYVLFLGNEVYEAHVWAEANGQRVKLRDRTFEAKIIDRKHRRGAADHGIEGRQQLTAPPARRRDGKPEALPLRAMNTGSRRTIHCPTAATTAPRR